MRYTISMAGVPSRALGALMPQPTTSPRASSGGLVEVVGHPGDMTIPAPKPQAIIPISQSRLTQPSYCAPDLLMPSIYYPTAANMHPPVSLARETPMPVPARSVLNLPRRSMRMRRVGGQSQIGQPAVIQSWPQWRGSAGRY